MKSVLISILLAVSALADVSLSGSVQLSGSVTVNNITSVPVDSFQDFRDGTVDQVISTAALQSGKLGGGTWSRFGGGSFESWTVVQAEAVVFKVPWTVNGSTVTSTGTKWIRVTHAELDEESISFVFGASDGTNRFCTLRCFVRFGAFNSTITGNNLDHLLTDGNPFGIMQEQLGNNTRKVIAHAPGGNGAAINLPPTGEPVYECVLIRDDVSQTITLRLYDPTGNYSLLGESIGDLGSEGVAWWIRFQAHYLDLGDITGYTEIGGVSVTWTNQIADP